MRVQLRVQDTLTVGAWGAAMALAFRSETRRDRLWTTVLACVMTEVVRRQISTLAASVTGLQMVTLCAQLDHLHEFELGEHVALIRAEIDVADVSVQMKQEWHKNLDAYLARRAAT